MLTLHAIALRFKNSDPPPVPVPRTDHLPIFSDNVIPSLLIHLRVLDLPTADAVRDQLTALGVQVEDTPAGPRWELSR